MDEPFAPAPDPTGGISLAPQGPLSALDLGVSAPLAQIAGPAPQLPQPAPPPMLPTAHPPIDPKQQLLAIAALGAMLSGGPRSGITSGFGQGVVNLQEQQRQEADRKQKLAEQDAQKQQALLAEQQRAEASRLAQRQQALQNALGQIHTRVTAIPDKPTYDQEISGYAKMLQASGYRLDENWLRSAVPYVAPTAEKLAGTALDAFLKNPANQTLLTQHPDQLSKVMLTLDVDGDGIPEQVQLLRVAQIAKKPFAVDGSGQLITYPKGTTLETKADADGIYADLLKQAQIEGKDINSPRVTMALRTQAMTLAAQAKPKDTTGATNSRLDKSYQFNSTQLEKERTPIAQRMEKISSALEDLGQQTPAADALVAPQILSVAAGGAGSGLRMNEAEISRIVGGRSAWENLKASLQHWSLDPSKALSLTPDQRNQMRQIVLAMQAKAAKKLNLLDQAGQDLVNAEDVTTHRAIVNRTRQQLDALDQASGENTAGPSDDVLATAAAKLRNRGR